MILSKVVRNFEVGLGWVYEVVGTITAALIAMHLWLY